ncbi:MAG TPA: type VI secretion system Vgr family protein [Noviherbaspirillum sp.]|nr:type VI secretion system Vgr family protein [Noviherbaspirillum sp.]
MSRVLDKATPVSSAMPAPLGGGRQSFLQSLTQHARLISIETSLGPGALVVERFSGREGMSDLFRFDVDCLATAAHFELKALVGEEVSLRMMLSGGGSRAFHGIVTRARQLGADGGLARYSLTLEPWMHALTLRRDSFVFQDKTVLEIISDVLSDYPSANYRFDVKAELPKRSLTIQYRESDYAFIQRLLAEEGLNFYFSHADTIRSPAGGRTTHAEVKIEHARHQLVVFDDNAHLSACAQRIIRFHRADVTEKDDTVTRFTSRSQVHANSVSLGSWDYKNVAATSTEDSVQRNGDSPVLEIFVGSGAYRYTDNAESARIARARVESLTFTHNAMRGESSARALATGTCFSLSGHPDADGEYVVLSIVHEGANNLSGGVKAIGSRVATEPGTYRNQFSCVSRSIPVRPSFWYPKPMAPGTQVGVVVGVNHEEITTERDHRIKVQFPWQRGDRPLSGQLSHPMASNAPGNETAGTWIRVAEPAAGANWGTHFIPRIGQEVCIEFLSGDIDRPVVTGQLYNGTDMPPMHGADNHPGALSGIRTKEYAAGGFNTWMIDDTPGQLRQTVAASYSASQLNVGYLLRQNGDVRGTYRGTGFELATDAWSTLRAKRGMFISTSPRSGAISTQLDTQEAQGKFTAAVNMARALSDAAAQHQALPLSAPDGVQQLAKVVGGSDGVDGQQVPTFGQTLMLIDSQAAVVAATPASSTMLSEQDMTLNASSATRITAGQVVTLVAAKTASLFTHAGGAKAFAAKEPVSIRAHTGPMAVLADKTITITSSNASIKLQAKQEILLASGGGYIKLAGANIDIHCPSSVSVKGVTHDFLGGGSIFANLDNLPGGSINFSPAYDRQVVLTDAQGFALCNRPYRIKLKNGKTIEGMSDSDGMIQLLESETATVVRLELLKKLANRG